MNMQERLEKCRDYGEIFALVRKAVKNLLKKERAAMMLALQDLPGHIGALHPVGTNMIVINRSLLNMVKSFRDRKEFNAYVFYILLHEYIHAIGYLDEQETLKISYHVCSVVLGEGHLSSIIARYGIGSVMPDLFMGIPGGQDRWIEFVGNFDIGEMGYIG